MISRLFSESQKRFIIHQVLNKFSASLDVQTTWFNGVADVVGEPPTPSWSHLVLQTQGLKNTLSQMAKYIWESVSLAIR